MNREAFRKIIHEEIKSVLQDDALFKNRDIPGILDAYETFDDSGDGRNLSYGSNKSTDHEGSMTKGELYDIFTKSQSLYDMLEDNDDLPEWVQSKVSKASDRIESVYSYLKRKIKTHDY